MSNPSSAPGFSGLHLLNYDLALESVSKIGQTEPLVELALSSRMGKNLTNEWAAWRWTAQDLGIPTGDSINNHRIRLLEELTTSYNQIAGYELPTRVQETLLRIGEADFPNAHLAIFIPKCLLLKYFRRVFDTHRVYSRLAERAQVEMPPAIPDDPLETSEQSLNHWFENNIEALMLIEELNLSDLCLTSVPGRIGELTSLRELDLSWNELPSLPDSFEKLTQLQILNLSGNKFTAIPRSIQEVTSLETLDLSHNQITDLPDELGFPVSIKILNLSWNNLSEIPDSFTMLSSLETLDISVNRLSSLLNNFGQLTSIQVFYLYANELSELPESTSAMVSLRELDLKDNHLSTLPDGFEELVSLTTIDLRGNEFDTRPEVLDRCNSLDQVYLDDT